MIEISNIHKSFNSKQVLAGVDLTINTGETMVIIGGSGCGKSVLLRHIIGLMQPDRGSVKIDGTDVSRINRKELFALRKRLGMLFQGAALFDSLTVAENVGLGLKEHSEYSAEQISDIVNKKLEMVGMSGTGGLMPAELSGGMKKRVGLARAIAMDPEYILYDEPTTGLDPIMADKINDLVIDLRNKMTLTSVAVTHDMVSASKIADRIAMLHQGKIIFCGTPEEIKRSPDERVQRFINGEAD
ncbi:MAG: ABC transporter ATP-binding protein [Candidatus Edwardsbacteria bacterium]|nr:ABC transporter ATP-binding protein [Candidatus Edwardsbacteria bacterium]MBU1577690.1 ABC transporter ATP-binding protein [Candidatus Edwardsbacteria bacterium]MBU2593751.1 ABC transporter ATP-binding protein [Candidatus Edwardsbacteria bacterium]